MPFAITPHPGQGCRLLLLCLALLCCLTLPVASRADQGDTASALFAAGKKSFQTGDFAQALTLFQQAQAAGLDKPALFHNMGVCHYRLGQYAAANKAFLRAATFPAMTALASYNLGLVAEKQGDRQAAIIWLQKVAVHAGEDDAKLVLLSRAALHRLQARQEGGQNWTPYVALGLGYDDNVALVDHDELSAASNRGDSFVDAFAFFRSPALNPAVGQDFFVQGNLSWRDYTDLHAYDTGSLRLEGRSHLNVSNLDLAGGLGYNYLSWDHAGYSQGPLVNLQAQHALTAGAAWRLRYEAKYHDILMADYEALQGWQHRATAEVFTTATDHRLLLGYTFEENNRQDHDLSPRRHLLNASLEILPLDRLSLTIGLGYQDSTYHQAGPDRNEDRYEASLLLSYALSSQWELSGHCRHTVNISSSPLYDFHRTITGLSLGYFF